MEISFDKNFETLVEAFGQTWIANLEKKFLENAISFAKRCAPPHSDLADGDLILR
jgi:hypothetical protein